LLKVEQRESTNNIATLRLIAYNNMCKQK